MPAVSKRQLKYIYVLRNKYKNKSSTPKEDQWIWKDEWTDVDYDSLNESQSYRVPKIQKELNDLPGIHAIRLLENNFSIELTTIIVKPSHQKSGVLTAVMKRIIEYANKNNLIISLYPSDEYGVSVETLINIYSKFGFKHNRRPIDKRFDKDSMLKHPDANVFESFSEFTDKINPENGIKIFDLDDTLVVTKAKIRVTDSTGTYEISPSDFTRFDTSNKELDFSDFTDPGILATGRIIQKTMDILKSAYPKMAISIVTARSNKFLIKNFLLKHGVNIHLDLIYAVTDLDFVKKYGTRNVPILKKFAVQELIERGFVDIEFYDDDKKNLKNVESLRSKDVKIKTHLIKESLVNEYLSEDELKQIEATADEYFKRLGLDIEFTRHFKERVNDRRNKNPITAEELSDILDDVFKRYGLKLRDLANDYEAVFKDLSTDINSPFVINYNKRKDKIEIIMKTIMRKRNFQTSNDVYKLKT